MNKPYAKIVTIVSSLTFILFGLALLIKPEVISSTNLTFVDEIGKIEVRAFYGGLEIGLGLLILFFDFIQKQTKSALSVVIASFGGIGLARAFAITQASEINNFVLYALIFELTLALLALACYLAIKTDSI